MKKNFFQFIPLLILFFSLLNTIYETCYSNYLLVGKHYCAILFVLTNVLLYLYCHNYGYYFTGITLMFGAFNGLAFTLKIVSKDIGFSINGFSIGVIFQPFSLYVLFLWLFIGWQLAFFTDIGTLLGPATEQKKNSQD